MVEPQSKTKEFTLGGERKIRRHEVLNSYYFPPSSLDKLLEKLLVQGFFLGKPSVSYKHITDYEPHLVKRLTQFQLTQLFGIELTPNEKYIAHLNLKGNSNKQDYPFELNLENHLKDTRDLELSSGYYRDKFHYNSWAEVHVKINGDNEGLVEQIVRQTLIKTKVRYEMEKGV